MADQYYQQQSGMGHMGQQVSGQPPQGYNNNGYSNYSDMNHHTNSYALYGNIQNQQAIHSQQMPPVSVPQGHIIDPNYSYGEARTYKEPSRANNASSVRREPPSEDGKFKVTLKGEFGEQYTCMCTISMDSLKLTDTGSRTVMHKYPLESISRWALRDNETFLFWVQDDSGKQKQVQLSSNSKTVSNILDTLTAACMQLCEMIEQEEYKRKVEGRDVPKPSQTNAPQRKGLVGWIAGKVSGTAVDGEDQEAIATSIPEGVEYWKDPDYDGWLRSQGEHIKTWRRRWFVLKDGYMFRFLNDNVTEQSKPRGCLNLGACKEITQPPKDVSQGPTIQCSVSDNNNIMFVADSVAERDLWIDILKRSASEVKNAKDGKYLKAHDEWMTELNAGFKALQKQAPNRTVEVLGYDTGSFSPSAPREEYHPTFQGRFGGSAPMSANQVMVQDRPVDNWKVCYTPDGRAYYYNPATGTSQWEAP